MKKFETGMVYRTRFISDSDSIVDYKIERRTEKSVWIKGKRFGIKVYNDAEFIYPDGKYSMCLILNAEKKIETRKVG